MQIQLKFQPACNARRHRRRALIPGVVRISRLDNNDSHGVRHTHALYYRRKPTASARSVAAKPRDAWNFDLTFVLAATTQPRSPTTQTSQTPLRFLRSARLSIPKWECRETTSSSLAVLRRHRRSGSPSARRSLERHRRPSRTPLLIRRGQGHSRSRTQTHTGGRRRRLTNARGTGRSQVEG